MQALGRKLQPARLIRARTKNCYTNNRSKVGVVTQDGSPEDGHTRPEASPSSLFGYVSCLTPVAWAPAHFPVPGTLRAAPFSPLKQEFFPP